MYRHLLGLLGIRRQGTTVHDIRDAIVSTFLDEHRARASGVEIDEKVRRWVEDCANNVAAGVYMLAKEGE